VISNTNWKHLQVIQNEALCIAMGCHHMVSIDHLHQETKVLPFHMHCDLLTKQYISCAESPRQQTSQQTSTTMVGEK